eukprot:TRINITY_DN7185_c0_g1_i1.p1 TRINITY_DN7185_c0_g1~~TRINITY_DN7185_c0_g1_i1.p1  ORF type:complete len:477 (-),score=125.69 TRINITY_DN7185_c0_g1_i1:197-1627(-)
MKSVLLFIVASLLAPQIFAALVKAPHTNADKIALSPFEELLQKGGQEALDEMCSQMDKNMSPLVCVKDRESMSQPGKDFLAKLSKSKESLNLDPVVLLPGLGGSGLEARIKKQSSPSWYCFKNLNWFRIWFGVNEIIAQPCWMDNLAIIYDPATGEYNNTEGVDLQPADFGGVGGVAYLDYVFGIPIPFTGVFDTMIKSLEEVGYDAGVNLVGAPYDWRYPATYANKIGWYKQLKRLIEDTYEKNGNKSVHIVTHSMGGPTANYFFSLQSDQWLSTYIKSFIPIAAPWSGAPKALRAIVSGDNFGLSFLNIDIVSRLKFRTVARQAGGVIELIPNSLLWSPNTVFVSSNQRNYTVSDWVDLFNDMGSPITATVYQTVDSILSDVTTPNVPTHCIYGYGVNTEIFYTYPDGNFDENPIIDDTDLGDGTVPLKSLQECQKFGNMQKQPVDVKEVQLVGHTEIIKDSEVIQYLLSIVTN